MHQPVMLNEVVGLLVRSGAEVFFDGTLGGGGHAYALLQAAGFKARLIGIDRDDEAIRRVTERLDCFRERIFLKRANFEDMGAVIREAGEKGVDGVLLDVGCSSYQIDEAGRGFSFSVDGPLDMRMDRSDPVTAAGIVNEYDERELADLIFKLGEERASRRIARAIVRRRMEKKFESTADLANVVSRASGGRRGRVHPATRTFQALRIAVNRELDCLEKGLREGIDALNPGGRMAVISFHSLEDRMVKHYFRNLCSEKGGYEVVTRKPVTPSEVEVEDNPRARSAKLRVIEKISCCKTGEVR